ncbi:hypothetical protein K1T71_011504 [Dendrolimus kikuchii]|uniref:Uncharacterized protein n=1 Tax=Dendrolimus kikuchii TaxID=765133 RepID=A0ACC1CNZ5_9NEOP|nr:hypothetical protein K1T71_011504 [Dendrolimus kikuchii]
MDAMYRSLLPLLLWTTVVVTAPQDAKNSDITYVKIEPIVDETPVEKIDNHRQSRIENLPLTIPGNITHTKDVESKPAETTNSSKLKRSDNRSRESSRENSPKEKPRKFQRKYTFGRKPPVTINNVNNQSKPINIAEPQPSNDSNKSETNSSLSEPDTSRSKAITIEIEAKPVTEVKVSENSEELHNVKEDSLSDKSEIDPTAIDFVSDNIAADTNKFESFLEITTTNYDTNDPGTAEVTTVKIETQNTTKITTLQLENQTKPTLSKRSSFKKSYSTPVSNLIERPLKRHFRSKCRCEKIWNCPKLQITVPRCPDEYFLCCF